MNRFLRTVSALLLVFAIVVQGPARAYAKEAEGPDYISEVKIAMGDKAENDLEGYTILKDENGKVIDLNQGAGGGWGSQGDKKVILGYKTTKNRSEAITDLAVMNMAGGYSVQEYEALIQQRMDSQVIPFVRKFQATIDEYRENIQSEDDVNRARAEYVREALNKFTDDDCGGAGLGDLFLNETKFEMGDEAYNKLSDAEKNKHCDIVTLFMQADGQMMLVIFSLLTRAADTAEESWIDRFTSITLDDLLDSYDMNSADAKAAAARDFEDDARLVLQNWDAFRKLLSGADEALATFENVELPDMEELQKNTEAALAGSDPVQQVEVYADLLTADTERAEVIEQAIGFTLVNYLEHRL